MRRSLAFVMLSVLLTFVVATKVVAADATTPNDSALFRKSYHCRFITVGDPYAPPGSSPTIKLKYREWYRPDASAVLVQLSGMQSHSQWFNENGDYLQSLGYNVYALDRRGSGFSEGMRGHVYSPFQWVADLAQFIGFVRAKNPGKPLHFLANSFGSRIAMTYAEAFPHSIDSLILDAPATNMLVSLPAATMVDVQFKIYQRFPTPLRDDFFTDVPDKLAFIQQDTVGLREITANTYKMGELINTGNLMLPSIRQLSMPVLVLVSLDDPIVDAPAMIASVYDRLETKKQLITYTGLKHYLLFSNRGKEVLDEIATWMGTTPTAATNQVKALTARPSTTATASATDAGEWINSVRQAMADAGIDPEATR